VVRTSLSFAVAAVDPPAPPDDEPPDDEPPDDEPPDDEPPDDEPPDDDVPPVVEPPAPAPSPLVEPPHAVSSVDRPTTNAEGFMSKTYHPAAATAVETQPVRICRRSKGT
jgi:hypothetical protein